MADDLNMSDSNTEYVLVTEYFHPDAASTGQLMTDLAVGLQERGLDMTVYTGQPNYHSGANTRQPRVTTHEGVLVKRIRAPQVRQSSMPRRLYNWAIFTIWMAVALLLSTSDRKRELIFVSNPPFLPVAMWFVCKIRDWEYTYIAYDLYPDEPVELGHIKEGGLIDQLWSKLDQRLLHRAKLIVALGPVMRERLSHNAGPGFDESKIVIIHNWADEEFIEPIPKDENWFSKEHGLVEPFTVLYSGNMAQFHDLETLVEAAAEFTDEQVQFLLIGEGDKKQAIVDLTDRLGIRGNTVKFLPYQPWDDLPYSLTSADLSVVAVREGFEGIVVSSKLYTAMATGRPVLAIAQPYDDESRIIDACGAGIHVPQGDVEGVVEAIKRWTRNPELVTEHGENAREAFESQFTKEHSVDEYYRLLTGEHEQRQSQAISIE
jgi:glycosyltransferase involved in cell wall biosynthesis